MGYRAEGTEGGSGQEDIGEESEWDHHGTFHNTTSGVGKGKWGWRIGRRSRAARENRGTHLVLIHIDTSNPLRPAEHRQPLIGGRLPRSYRPLYPRGFTEVGCYWPSREASNQIIPKKVCASDHKNHIMVRGAGRWSLERKEGGCRW